MKKISIALIFVLLISVFLPTWPRFSTAQQPTQVVERLLMFDQPDAKNLAELKTETSLAQSGAISELEALSSSGEVLSYKPFWIQNCILVTGTQKAFSRLESLGSVRAVLPNTKIYLPHAGRSKVETDIEWNLKATHVPEAWAMSVKGEGVLVGVLDSGCDSTHPELSGKVQSFASFDSYGRKTGQTVASDSDGHGTSVCSVVCGETLGVAPKAKLIVGSVIPDGSGNISQILGGLQWITDPDDDPSTDDYPRVVNMSFGASGTMDYLKTAIKNLRKLGILPVASIGNDGEGSSSNPGNMPEVLSVGSVDYGLKASGFSGGAEVVWENEDDSLTLVKPDLCAPGENIRVATPRRTYDVADGTSFSSPHVVGICALLLEKRPDISPEDLTYLLTKTAVDLGRPGRDRRYGEGLVDARDSLSLALSMEPKTVSVTWPTGSALWGDINVTSGDRSYVVSREQAKSFTFLSRPGEETKIGAFGFESSPLSGSSIELKPLPEHSLDLTVHEEGTQNNLDSKVTLKDSPLPTFEAPDGTLKLALPEGEHEFVATSFGHASRSFRIKLSSDLSASMPLEKAKLAFIDTRKPVWGMSPEPIRGKLKPALDSTGLPYFIWSTLQGNVTAKQLGAFQYVVWNSGGSLSAKDVGILGGYMDMGGKLVLTSDFYGASFIGQTDSTVFLDSYFACRPSDEGGAALTHWDGKTYKSLALGNPSAYFSTSNLVPMSEKAKILLSYAGTSPKKYAGLKVSTLKNQGIILGFTFPNVASEEDRGWLLKLCIDSFEDTLPWKADIKTDDGKLPSGNIAIGGETIDFTGGNIFVPHLPLVATKIEISSFGYKKVILEDRPENLPSQIMLEPAPLSGVSFESNSDGYLIFNDKNVEPIKFSAKGEVRLPEGKYKVVAVSRGRDPVEVDVVAPGRIALNMRQSQKAAVVFEEADDIKLTLSEIGIPYRTIQQPTVADIVSSGLIVWNHPEKISSSQMEMIGNVKTALLCGAGAIIAGPELCRAFGRPVQIDSATSPVYASMGENELQGILISNSKSMRNYSMSIPVISGGDVLARFIGQGASIIKHDNLIACSFGLQDVDLANVKAELIRRLAMVLGFGEGRLLPGQIVSPSKAVNTKSVEISGFAPPASKTSITIDGVEKIVDLDPEGFFSFWASLAEGKHECVLISQSNGLLARSAPHTVTIDTTPPSIVMYSPKGGKTPSLEIEVLANVRSASKVLIDGKPVRVEGTLLRTTVPAGSGSILISCEDEAGNRSEVRANYTPSPGLFADAQKSGSFFEIGQLACANILKNENGQFYPSESLSRGKMVIWVALLLGLDPKPGKSTYEDVPKNSPEEPFIGALVQHGTLSGKGKFYPTSACTRELIVQVLSNGLRLGKKAEKMPFSDIKQDNVYSQAILRCVFAGIIDPAEKRLFSGGKFGLGQKLSREQACIMLYNALVYRARGEQ